MEKIAEDTKEDKPKDESKDTRIASKKELAVLQIALKNTRRATGYDGIVDGNLDPSIGEAIRKGIEFIKAKLPEDPAAQTISLSVSSDGSVTGPISVFVMLLNKAGRIELYKVFEKSPFVTSPIIDEASFKSAVENTKAGIKSSFGGVLSEDKIVKLLGEFDIAVATSQIKMLEQALSQLSSFKKSAPGSAVKTAVNLAEKNANQIIKTSNHKS